MSDENNTKSEMLKKAGSTLAKMQKNSPKLFFGGAAIILVLLLYFFVGSGEEQAPQMQTAMVKGQVYTLKNPNGGNVLLTVRPMFGSAESGDDMNVCLVESGTRAKFQEQTVVNTINYIKVAPESGDCQGKSGWTSKVSISQ